MKERDRTMLKFYDMLLNKEAMTAEDLEGMFQLDESCTYALSWADADVDDRDIMSVSEIIKSISDNVDLERYDWIGISVVPAVIEENLHADAIVVYNAGYGYREW